MPQATDWRITTIAPCRCFLGVLWRVKATVLKEIRSEGTDCACVRFTTAPGSPSIIKLELKSLYAELAKVYHDRRSGEGDRDQRFEHFPPATSWSDPCLWSARRTERIYFVLPFAQRCVTTQKNHEKMVLR